MKCWLYQCRMFSSAPCMYFCNKDVLENVKNKNKKTHTCQCHWHQENALAVFSTGCHTHLKCDNSYVGLHGVFTYDSRLPHQPVQFAASVTKPVSDKIKAESRWCTAWRIWQMLETDWNNDIIKQLSFTGFGSAFYHWYLVLKRCSVSV